ncbi:actin family [Scheffersomyces coipomensis]|uniref:actin family n=1 Tax=Scheffersomyces coipomensis TaxID=1788519 RepID=UPI00315DCDBF
MVKKTTATSETYVVISIGSRFLRVGLSNGTEPIIHHYPTRGTSDNVIESHMFDLNNNVGLTISQKRQLQSNLIINENKYKKFHKLNQKQNYKYVCVDSFGGLSISDENTIHQLLFDIFSVELMINPKRYKVLVVDNRLSAVHKLQISKILLEKFQFKSLVFVPEPQMSVISSGQRNGLVIDFGWNSVKVHPIYDFRSVMKSESWEDKLISGRSLHLKMTEYLSGLNDPQIDQLLQGPDSFEFIENLIMKYCYVRRKETISDDSSQFEIMEGVSIPNSFRYEIIESLYINEILFDAVSQIINNLDIHIRREVIENLILVGGISNIPGFKLRMIEEFDTKSNEYKVASNSCLGSWTGASIYSNLLQQQQQQTTKLEITKHDLNSITSSTGFKLFSFSNHFKS